MHACIHSIQPACRHFYSPVFEKGPANRTMLDENRDRRDNFSDFGGIAQLVERLVRNEKVRGSNPLTSKASKRRGNVLKRAHFRITSGSVIPLPPVFARSPLPLHLAWQSRSINSRIYDIQDFSRRRHRCFPHFSIIAWRADSKIAFTFANAFSVSKQTANATNSISRNGFGSRSEEQNVHH